MTKAIMIRVAVVLVGILLVLLGRGLFCYRGFYTPPPPRLPSYEHVVIPQAPSGEFYDEITEGEGIVLIDLAHENSFEIEELNVLLLRLISRDMTIRFLDAEDDLGKELIGKEILEEEEDEEADQNDGSVNKEEAEPEGEVAKELPDAFVIVCPGAEFSAEERGAISEFVEGGGKLLLIADPTRQSRLNSLSFDFGLLFEPDYLYNLKENDINYRNIYITHFVENEITEDLAKIVLYTAGSISSVDGGIARVDENTFSSLIETRRELSPIALTEEAKVLAISDFTFMAEPYNGAHDNNRLIANIADWLASPVTE
ncbi:MAG: hypothetical protein JSW30_01415 [Dehalococcoidia bacterium]|nr:MAG: hypothetical protein JSW30_01415 [Dehalococcoidia bacterium]